MNDEIPTDNFGAPCLECQHFQKMGYRIPDDEITVEIARRFCPNCRARLPFEKLGCPISLEHLKALCDYIDNEFEPDDCDNTLGYSVAFCRNENLPVDLVLEWLTEHGAHCDCEVMYNIARRYLKD